MSSFGSWKIPCVYARKKSVAIWNNSALFLSVLMFSESTEDKKKQGYILKYMNLHLLQPIHTKCCILNL